MLYLAVRLSKTLMMGVTSKCNFNVKVVNKKHSRDRLHTQNKQKQVLAVLFLAKLTVMGPTAAKELSL